MTHVCKMPLKMNFRDSGYYAHSCNTLTYQKCTADEANPGTAPLFCLDSLSLCQCQHIIFISQSRESRTNTKLPNDRSYIWEQLRRSRSVHFCTLQWLVCGRRLLPDEIL